MSIPKGPEEVTPAWLTGVLRAGGHMPPDAAVVSIEAEGIGAGAGFIGQLVRLRLRCDREGIDAPRSIIAKFPSPDEGARAMANLYGLYEREVRFYGEIAHDVGLGTPRCYHAAMDADAGSYLLLLEDLAATGRIGDQVKGCSPDEALLAVGELAQMHGAWWSSPRLEAVPWLTPGADLVRAGLTQAYPLVWQTSIQMFGDRLGAGVCAAAEGLSPRLMRLLDAIEAESPQTLVHGDFRLDNMFFGNGDATHRLAVLDWQSPNRGWGAYDLAYFMAGNVSVEQRRACEQEILAAYHQRLVEAGVRGYSPRQLFDDYRRSLLVYLGIFLIDAALLEMANDRAVDLMNVIFDRLGAAIADLGALDLLPA
jgi:aminoglycoside/choline kinase family phosphotransferase